MYRMIGFNTFDLFGNYKLRFVLLTLVDFLGRFWPQIRTQREKLYRIHHWNPKKSSTTQEQSIIFTSIKLTRIKV